MQTEEINTKEAEEIPILNQQLDIEMTVKEETEQSVEFSEKSKTSISKCMSTGPSSRFSATDEQNCTKGSTLEQSCPLDNSRQLTVSLPQDKTFKNHLHELSASESASDSLASPATQSSPQQKTEKERDRGKRRSRWKLKFHHQALPQEYLDHYKASIAQQEAAATAVSAKPATLKAEHRSKVDHRTLSSKHSIKAPAGNKTDKLMLQSTQCAIKIEQETSKLDVPSPPSAQGASNSNVMDQLNILPIQTLSISDDSDSICKNQDEIRGIKEKSSSIIDKSSIINDNILTGKGLLGTLLTSTITSEINNKSANENDRKRKSVIMSTTCGNSSNATISRAPSPSSSNGMNSNKMRSYQDLPYMGEITLDNMKPRRGRKPKKADICHLIYKNYGTTVFPPVSGKSNTANEEWIKGRTPETSHPLTTLQQMNIPEMNLKQEYFLEPSLKCKPFESLKQSPPVSHSDVQNRIISSLLEKRLMSSQEGKKSVYGNANFTSDNSIFELNDTIAMKNHDSWSENTKCTTTNSDEPLNLCVKDLNQLKIRLLRKHGNFYEPRSNHILIKSEPSSPSSNQDVSLFEPHNGNSSKLVNEAEGIETEKSQVNPLIQRNESERNCETFTFAPDDCSRASPPMLLNDEVGSANNSPLPGGYIYWPSAGVFVHPMALQSQFLYYQKMGAIPLLPLPSAEPSTFTPSHIPHVNVIPHLNSPVPPRPSATTSSPIHKKEHKSSVNKTLIPKAFSMMSETNSKTTTSVSPSEISFSRLKRLVPLGNPPIATTPTKRKRSAIFIPPMPSENSTNPTTEVSICKFKFTGGAKPSLQEKKMLSVDSGGNFRYYSGTGDKSMRGYEFFPRETLQQSSISGGTSAEQFLAASTVGNSEKLIGNSTVSFVPEESKTMHLQNLNTTTELSPSDEAVNLTEVPEDELESCNSHNFEQQMQSGSLRKRTEFLVKGNKSSVCSESELYGSVTNNDNNCRNSISQVRIRRKRKTRKSLAREKLEQTFKEKGFLIQTQQLESAEGATYCKFRQLRKFTRYLFRSWKDYLPGNVREMSVAAGVAAPETSPVNDAGQAESEADGEVSCSNSPKPSSQITTESSTSLPTV